VLDIGVFTGASSLAAALALPAGHITSPPIFLSYSSPLLFLLPQTAWWWGVT